MATKWGIISCGKISHDFVTAVRSLPDTDEHKIVAVAARSIESAKSFAQLHNIPKAYGSYEELSKDQDVAVVYIGTIHPYHFAIAEMMLQGSKHLLIEKPMCMNLKQTEHLVALAKEKKRFLMEAIWSRFLPSYEHLMSQLKSGTIGEPLSVAVTFGVKINDVDRVTLKELGGGATLDIGIYCLNAISMVYGGEKPLKLAAVGHLNENGVDESIAVSLSYSEGRLASILATTKQSLPCELEIFGTQGKLKLGFPMWCSTTVTCNDETTEFPMPPTVLPCNFLNSSGLRYEAMEVKRCIAAGLIESPRMSHADSQLLASQRDEILSQIGVVYEET